MNKSGMISCDNLDRKDCELCLQAKMTKKSFSKVKWSTKVLDLVHFDICEVNGTVTRRGNHYFITFIDDYSIYILVHLMKSKDQASDVFKLYKAIVEY